MKKIVLLLLLLMPAVGDAAEKKVFVPPQIVGEILKFVPPAQIPQEKTIPKKSGPKVFSLQADIQRYYGNGVKEVEVRIEDLPKWNINDAMTTLRKKVEMLAGEESMRDKFEQRKKDIGAPAVNVWIPPKRKYRFIISSSFASLGNLLLSELKKHKLAKQVIVLSLPISLPNIKLGTELFKPFTSLKSLSIDVGDFHMAAGKFNLILEEVKSIPLLYLRMKLPYKGVVMEFPDGFSKLQALDLGEVEGIGIKFSNLPENITSLTLPMFSRRLDEGLLDPVLKLKKLKDLTIKCDFVFSNIGAKELKWFCQTVSTLQTLKTFRLQFSEPFSKRDMRLIKETKFSEYGFRVEPTESKNEILLIK